MRARSLGALLTLTVAGCAAGPPRPVEITLNEEACSSCRMAISQREFAAEVVDPAGGVEVFDDIGCLRDWLRAHRLSDQAVVFVVDYASGTWIEAAGAIFVASEKLPTPMGSGLAAFDEEEAARAEAQRLGGRLLRWQQVRSEPVS